MTVTTLRPSADLSKTNVTLSTGTAMFSLIDDSPADDATYIVGTTGFNYPNSKAFVTFPTATLTVSATQRIKQTRYRARLRLNASDPGHSATVGLGTRLADSSDTFIEKFTTSNASTFQEFVGVWRTKPQNGHGTEWTEALVEATRAFISFFYSIGSVHANLRLSELYFDVDVRDQPVVTGVTVTGNTTTTRPTVSWLYVPNADGDQQVAVQVKVFSSAQYGSTNFDPETDESTWDSTVLTGDAPSAVVGVDLVNGATYKAYVKAAQDFNGTSWFSTWVASSAFTITLTPPATPTLTGTLALGPPGYRALLDITAPINLLTADAASFETSVNQWTAETNCSVSRVTTDAADGVASLQLSSTAAGAMSATSGQDPFLGYRVQAGRTYTAVASFRAGTVGRQVSVGIRWFNAAGSVIQTDMGTSSPDVTGSYTQVSATAVAPATALTASVRVNVAATGGAAELHRVDKVGLTRGTSTTWTFGGTANSQEVTLERGERLDASRGAALNWASPQVASGGSTLQNEGFGFRIVNDSGLDKLPFEFISNDFAQGSGLLACAGTLTNQPTGAIRWQPHSGAAASLYIGSWFYAGAFDSDWQFPVVVGSVHVLSFWSWVVTGTLAMTPKIDWIGDDGTTVVSTTTGSIVTLTTTPQRVIVTGTAPATASAARGVLTNHTSAQPAGIYVTRVGFGLGTTPVDDHVGRGGPIVWTPVRFTDAVQNVGLLPWGYEEGQERPVADYELPAARPVLYRARQTATINGSSVASAFSPYVTLYATAPAKPIVLNPLQPETALVLATGYGDSITPIEDGGEFHALGRDDDPVFLRDWTGHTVSLTAVANSDEEFYRLNAIMNAPQGVMIQWPDGGRWYVRVTEYPATRLRPGIFKHTWSGRLVAAPAVP